MFHDHQSQHYQKNRFHRNQPQVSLKPKNSFHKYSLNPTEPFEVYLLYFFLISQKVDDKMLLTLFLSPSQTYPSYFYFLVLWTHISLHFLNHLDPYRYHCLQRIYLRASLDLHLHEQTLELHSQQWNYPQYLLLQY